jgi:hypothetical protein
MCAVCTKMVLADPVYVHLFMCAALHADTSVAQDPCDILNTSTPARAAGQINLLIQRPSMFLLSESMG